MTNDTLKEALEGLRVSMNREHNAVWRAGVDAIFEEMALSAAGIAIERASIARERLFNVLVPTLPPPAQQASTPLQSPANVSRFHVPDPLEEEEFEAPKFMNGGAR